MLSMNSYTVKTTFFAIFFHYSVTEIIIIIEIIFVNIKCDNASNSQKSHNYRSTTKAHEPTRFLQ